MRSLPFSRTARRRFKLDTIIPPSGAAPAPTRRLAANIAQARKVTLAVNATRRAGEPSAQAGELAALELLHEIEHLLVARAAELVPATAMDETGANIRRDVGARTLDDLLGAVGEEFPDVAGTTPQVRLEELLLVRVDNENPAVRPLRDLVDDTPLPTTSRGQRVRRAGALPGRTAADRSQRRDPRGAAARPGPCPPDVPRRSAPLYPRALGRPARQRP